MARLNTRTIVESLHFGDQMFRTLKGVRPIHSPQGGFKFACGRHSVLLEAEVQQRRCGLKCYISPQPHLEAICDLLSYTHNGLIVTPTALPQELWVGDRYVDVALYPWVEGHTLDREVRRAIYNKDQSSLAHLAEEFRRLALSLLECEWRHGDLKCENIIVGPDGTMTLIDCDAIYSHELPFRGEIGTPPYIHSSRKEAYDTHLDDYAIALIITSLEALAADPALADKESMVAAPSENNKEAIERIFANNAPLGELHAALYGTSYAIDNLKHIIKCIKHR